MDHTKSPPSSVPCPARGGKVTHSPQEQLPGEHSQQSRQLGSGISWSRGWRFWWLSWDLHQLQGWDPTPMYCRLLGWPWGLLVPENSTITGMLPQQLQAAWQGWTSPGRSRASPSWVKTQNQPSMEIVEVIRSSTSSWNPRTPSHFYLLSFHLPLPSLGVTTSLHVAHAIFLFNNYNSKKILLVAISLKKLIFTSIRDKKYRNVSTVKKNILWNKTKMSYKKCFKISDLLFCFTILSHKLSLPVNFAALMIHDYRMCLGCRGQKRISDEKENTHNIFQCLKF